MKQYIVKPIIVAIAISSVIMFSSFASLLKTKYAKLYDAEGNVMASSVYSADARE